MPTNNKINTRLYFIYLNLSIIFAKKKYKFLKPKIAKILEVNTMNESVVTANIAGIESTANNTSLNSTTIKVAKEAVMNLFPFFLPFPLHL